jgi:hypothetical protein
MEEKTVLRQKIAHENASRTFDKSQYERADTEGGKSITDGSSKKVTD